MVSAFFQLADAFVMVHLGTLNGAGDTRFVLYSTVSVGWLTKVPLGWYLASVAGMGAVGAWWSIVVEVVVLWGVLEWRLRRGNWQRAALAEATALPAAA